MDKVLLRTFVDQVPAAIAMLDRDMIYLAASRRYLTDYNIQDPTGRCYYDVFPEIAEPAKELLRGCLATGVLVCQEHEFTGQDGRVRRMRQEIQPWREASGEIGGVLILSEVPSERKEIEATPHADERFNVDEFLAVLGHDLRTPLAAIATALDVLAHTGKDTRTAGLLDVIVRQTALMRRLLDDLPEFGRIARGHIELIKAPVDLAAALRAAARSVRPMIRNRSQELTVRTPAEPVRFMADRVRLEQIIVNLLKNASDRTEPGGGIELSGAREGSDVVLGCRYNGHGFSLERQGWIFDPFFNFTNAGDDDGRVGPGLGPALARRLAELHGGTISVASAGPGLGSELTVRLPLVAPPAARSARTGARSKPAKERRPSKQPGPVRVLLVEDHAALADATAQLLRQQGLEVRIASAGREALDLMPGFAPQLLLCDLNLRDMKGLEVIRRWRLEASNASTYAAILTAMSRADLDVYNGNAAKLGVDAFISKPLTREMIRDLVSRLRAWRRRPNARDES